MNQQQEISYMDRKILRKMLESGCGSGRWLATNEIADISEANWKTAYLHLEKLCSYNLVKKRSIQKKILLWKNKYKKPQKKKKVLYL